jgi:peptidoglycan hydrolase CwlO-like protein
MRKTILIIGIFIIFSAVSLARTQNDTILQLKQHIENLEKLNARLARQVETANIGIRKLEAKVTSATDSLNSMKQELARTNSDIQAMSDKLEQQISLLNNKTDSGFSLLDIRIKHNTLIFIIIAIVAIIMIPVFLILWFTRRLASVQAGLSDQMKDNSGEIREEIKKLDNQVFWSLDLLKGQDSDERQETEKTDHSLALKVADEIIRIQKNINGMDPETKGLKQMEFAIERIRDNFRDSGYEIVDLLNKPYNEGMLVTAKFIEDKNLKPDERIITRIIKPQVKYNDTIIQDAEVEVSTGQSQT